MKNQTPEKKPTPDEILIKRSFYGYTQGQLCQDHPDNYVYLDYINDDHGQKAQIYPTDASQAS